MVIRVRASSSLLQPIVLSEYGISVLLLRLLMLLPLLLLLRESDVDAR